MKIYAAIMMASITLTACAHEAAAPVPAPLAARAASADVEPDVTQQVSAILRQVAEGKAPVEQMTENAKNALHPERTRQMGAALAACGPATALTLLERSTKGEQRSYLYRASCTASTLLVEISFGKGARIADLSVRPESGLK